MANELGALPIVRSRRDVTEACIGIITRQVCVLSEEEINALLAEPDLERRSLIEAFREFQRAVFEAMEGDLP
ncbi:MAG TPA: hypothetical protein VGE07_10605 [Herpetosiphonaceae bacterium]